MSMLEDVADGLARRTLALIEATGDETLEKKVAEEIGASSPTLQESFSTAMRIRKAEARAMRMLARVDGDSAPSDRVVTPPPQSKPEPAKEPEKQPESAKADESLPVVFMDPSEDD